MGVPTWYLPTRGVSFIYQPVVTVTVRGNDLSFGESTVRYSTLALLPSTVPQIARIGDHIAANLGTRS